jgi:hypothetical protein
MSRVAVTLLLSGALGFWLGIAARPSWHTPIETAQVIAGLVTYPATNPFFIYHVKLWSVMHEALAAALALGVSEVTLSRALSGLVGMLSFQALSAMVFAFSRRVWYSTTVAFVIFVSRAAEYGGVYPIHLLGTSHTYGVVGLSVSVLTIALLGNGLSRAGGLLLGLGPALHPSMGVWTIAIVALAMVIGGRSGWTDARRVLPWFAAGCGVAAVSLAVHFALTPSIPAIDPDVANRYLEALLAFWDGHRLPADLNHPAVWINAGLLAVSIVWLTWLSQTVPVEARLVLRCLLVGATLSLTFTLLSWLPFGWLPASVQILMPLRLLNVAAMIAPALIFGLAGAWRRTWTGQVLALALSAGLLVSLRSELWPLLPGGLLRDMTGPIFDLRIDALVLMAVVTVGISIAAWLARDGQPPDAAATGAPSRTAVAIGVVHAGLIVALLAVTLPALRTTTPVVLQYPDRRHHPIFATAARERGILLTGNGLRLIQLRTRRPVLVDGGGLDGLAYSLDAGPELNRILRDVYGLDLLNPPADGEGRGAGTIPPGSNRLRWEQYSLERWREIRRGYDVTQVLTTADWQLQLPVRASTPDLRLYQIPE